MNELPGREIISLLDGKTRVVKWSSTSCVPKNKNTMNELKVIWDDSTTFMVFSVTYYLELHNAITFGI